MKLRWIWLPITLLLWTLAPGVRAQSSRKDDVVLNARGLPLAGATVRVCAMPASGQPCTLLALIYSDAALTQALANPTTTDGLGNYFFYAAPGKYMIEIAGPGITTRQLPNVILPNDPTAPSFNSVSSSGAMSAFSLNLGGNLTVNGNATVAGSLAGGTMNLTNQGAAPGAASAGTVNLYTKTADKRLYYKDDSGAEIGPVSGGGVSTGATNTWTAQQNFDGNTAFKGPSPWIDITRYGGRAFTSTPSSTTGSITTGTTTLTLAGAIDFINGDGIAVQKAGATSILTTPASVVVTPVGILNGATTYNYQIVAEDYNGALTAASTAASTAAGAATLGANSATLTGCTSTNGVLTCTASAAHNFQVGAEVYISGTTSNVYCNGVTQIASTPTGTTFTTDTYDNITASGSTCTGGTAQILAGNKLTWTAYSAADQTKTIRFWIYRSVGAGAYSLVGVAQGNDNYWVDYNWGTPGSVPAYVPATPPVSTTPGILSTTIVSGAGTTTLTLAAAASNTASGSTVLHDAAPAILAARAAADAQGGGVVLLPAAPGTNVTSYYINSIINLPHTSSFITFRIAGGLFVNQPIFTDSLYTFEGLPGNGSYSQIPSFSTANYAVVIGNSYPEFYAVCRNGVTFKNLLFIGNQPQQVNILLDGNSGCGNTEFQFTDTYSMGNGSGATALKIRGGGFGYHFDRGGFVASQNSVKSLQPEAIRITSSNSQAASQALAYLVDFRGTAFQNKGIRIDNDPGGSTQIPSWFSMNDVLYESGNGPMVRLNSNGAVFGSTWSFSRVVMADLVVGFTTPFIEMYNSTNLQGMILDQVTPSSPNQPLIGGGGGNGINILGLGSSGSTLKHGLTSSYNPYIFYGPLAGTAIPQFVVGPPESLVENSNVPAGVAGWDLLWADSASHTLKANNNNGGAVTLAYKDLAQTWTGNQTNMALVMPSIAGETISAAPRGEQNVFLPGALTSTWTGSTWTLDKAVSVTRIEAQAKTAPAGCTTNAVVRVTDGTTPLNVTLSAATNSSGAIAQNYAAGAALTIGVTTAAAGCTTSPADVNVTVQYKMQ